jgi:hypothetical protein
MGFHGLKEHLQRLVRCSIQKSILFLNLIDEATNKITTEYTWKELEV